MAPLQNEVPAPVATLRPAWRRLLPVLAVVVVAWMGVRWMARAEHRPQLIQGQAPPVTLTLFDGSELELAALAGRGVVVNFWASWCAPCRVEAELLEAAWRREAQAGAQDSGIVFVGVNRQDTRTAAQAFLDEFGVSYPNGADDESTWRRAFGVIGLPTTFFIDAEGKIEAVVWGPITSEGELARQLDRIRP